jgi:hypothetical protein
MPPGMHHSFVEESQIDTVANDWRGILNLAECLKRVRNQIKSQQANGITYVKTSTAELNIASLGRIPN